MTLASLEGAGCIRRIFVTTVRRPSPGNQRQTVLRFFWDGSDTPAVEAPLGDFFGQLHGLPPYPLNSRYLISQAHSGYTATFAMPFARGARIEVEAGPDVDPPRIILFVDWHTYPDGSLEEPLRFHAQFRRENPCEAFGRNYLLLHTVGRGCLVGFNYGVAVRDDRARWSHAGAENVYVSNETGAPEGTFAYLRGGGGEDSFGASYGGVLHQPSSHLDQGVPYYAQEDLGPAYARHTLAAYRFFTSDAIPFSRSIHVRFGSMANDICSTAYWYQEPPHEPFFKMPGWDQLLRGTELRYSATGAPRPDARWRALGPFHPDASASLHAAADQSDPHSVMHDTGYAARSPWRHEDRHVARWVAAEDLHGFVDFGLAFRPSDPGNSVTWPALGLAQTWLHADADIEATLYLGWAHDLRLRIDHEAWQALGQHAYFRNATHRVKLRAGWNRVQVTLISPDSGIEGTTWGAWTFGLRAVDADGREIEPRLDPAA
ncbi:MAG: DUF2961 domain-containing protein [Chloroflexi bacterium]|nr:DUF2961 domain-containing protein [Chloroflexota bacterium]